MKGFMMKLCFAIPFLLSFLPQTVLAQQPTPKGEPSTAATSAISTKLPTEVKLVLSLEEMPGLENPKSFWEGDYELRIADRRTVIEKTRTGDKTPHGDVLSKLTSPRRTLIDKENRFLRISVPVAGVLEDRLKQQNTIPQSFLLQSTVRIFDAQLKQNFVFEVNRVWEFKLFPDGLAEITLKIGADSSYSTWGPVPKTLPKGYTMIGVPAAKAPATASATDKP